MRTQDAGKSYKSIRKSLLWSMTYYLTLVTLGGFGPLRSHGRSRSGTTIFKFRNLQLHRDIFFVRNVRSIVGHHHEFDIKLLDCLVFELYRFK